MGGKTGFADGNYDLFHDVCVSGDPWEKLRNKYGTLIDTIPGCLEILGSSARVYSGKFWGEKESKKVYQRLVGLLFEFPGDFLKEFREVGQSLLKLMGTPDELYPRDSKDKENIRERILKSNARGILNKKASVGGKRRKDADSKYEECLPKISYVAGRAMGIKD